MDQGGKGLLDGPSDNSPADAGDVRDVGSISGSGRSPGIGNGSPLVILPREARA